MKVTVPVGKVVGEVTNAVNSTIRPAGDGFSDEARLALVEAGFTVSVVAWALLAE